MENLTPNETIIPEEQFARRSVSNEAKILIKSAITGLLILLMLIPMAFIESLISERKERQADVVQEVNPNGPQTKH